LPKRHLGEGRFFMAAPAIVGDIDIAAIHHQR
jgi:hypothetical protein